MGSGLLVAGRCCVGVQVLERAWLNLAGIDERIHFGLLQTNDSSKSVRGQLPFVNEPVERPRRDA